MNLISPQGESIVNRANYFTAEELKQFLEQKHSAGFTFGDLGRINNTLEEWLLAPEREVSEAREKLLCLALRLGDSPVSDEIKNNVFRLLEHCGERYASSAVPALAEWLSVDAPLVWRRAAASAAGAFPSHGNVLARPLFQLAWDALAEEDKLTANLAAGSLLRTLPSSSPEFQEDLKKALLEIPEQFRNWGALIFHGWEKLYEEPELVKRVLSGIQDGRMRVHKIFLYLDESSVADALRMLKIAPIVAGAENPQRGNRVISSPD